MPKQDKPRDIGFELARVLWEARIDAAWHPDSAKLRKTENPWPKHRASMFIAASHDLAIAQADAILKKYQVIPLEEKE